MRAFEDVSLTVQTWRSGTLEGTFLYFGWFVWQSLLLALFIHNTAALDGFSRVVFSPTWGICQQKDLHTKCKSTLPFHWCIAALPQRLSMVMQHFLPQATSCKVAVILLDLSPWSRASYHHALRQTFTSICIPTKRSTDPKSLRRRYPVWAWKASREGQIIWCSIFIGSPTFRSYSLPMNIQPYSGLLVQLDACWRTLSLSLRPGLQQGRACG